MTDFFLSNKKKISEYIHYGEEMRNSDIYELLPHTKIYSMFYLYIEPKI